NRWPLGLLVLVAEVGAARAVVLSVTRISATNSLGDNPPRRDALMTRSLDWRGTYHENLRRSALFQRLPGSCSNRSALAKKAGIDLDDRRRLRCRRSGWKRRHVPIHAEFVELLADASQVPYVEPVGFGGTGHQLGAVRREA